MDNNFALSGKSSLSPALFLRLAAGSQVVLGKVF